MELRNLRHFVAVAELKHFTKAAEALSITQSGLSASIRALERELRTPLFVRSSRKVELTQAGHALLAESRRTLASAEAARSAVAAVTGLLGGTLAVGAEQCIGTVDVPALLARFHSAHPGVKIVFRQAGSAALLGELAGGRLDVAFVAAPGSAVPGVRLLSVARAPMVLVCYPGHTLASSKVVPLARLASETFIDFGQDWAARQITEHAFVAARLDHHVALEVNDVHTLLDLVGAGAGVALVPAPIAAKKASSLPVVPLEPDAAGCWEVSAALPAGMPPSTAARELLQLVPGRLVPRGTGPAAGGVW